MAVNRLCHITKIHKNETNKNQIGPRLAARQAEEEETQFNFFTTRHGNAESVLAISQQALLPRELRTIRNTAVAALLEVEKALAEDENLDDVIHYVKNAERFCLKIVNKMQ